MFSQVADLNFLIHAKQTADSLRKRVQTNYNCLGKFIYVRGVIVLCVQSLTLCCSDPVNMRYTDERYLDCRQIFQLAKKEMAMLDERREANVLSLFSGIGAGILVLKRLGVAIDICVVVEHDPMAEAVCSEHHKKDVDSYVWIQTFEELENSLDQIIEKYGPFDIVEGGPPCTECK